MNRQKLLSALTDISISDEKFFHLLLKYLNGLDKKTRTSREVALSISEIEKIDEETTHLRKQIEKDRPKIMEMLEQHVLKQHGRCCGSKANK